MIKARPVAGNLDLGDDFLQDLQPWVFRRYLNRADITEIKALKRKLGRHTGNDQQSVWLAPGGIRDIEFVVQFLQLLNAGSLPALRTAQTQQAITELASAGCLTQSESTTLLDNYQMLCRTEHLLQIMIDPRTHALPEQGEAIQRLAARTGYDGAGDAAAAALRQDLQSSMRQNQQVLNSLLDEAFGEDSDADPVVDLILDPEPSAESICDVLLPYGFQQIDAAYQNLNSLADERIPFLSTRRCRHFLSAIAPSLLGAISATPDPDATLATLSRVSESLGGKGVLWELFSLHDPSLNLYVRLCAASPYLATILTGYPGMIDELMDSLILAHLPSRESQRTMLEDLCRNTDELLPVLHSFKNAQHLNVGVRDILGKDQISDTMGSLSDIAEVCLQKAIEHHYAELVRRYGTPADEEGRPIEFVVMGLGKLGGREPNYHSTTDIMLLYEADGATQDVRPARASRSTSNQHFFSELARHTIQLFNHVGPLGRLYELDVTLRSRGEQGALAMSLEMFQQHYRSDRCTLAQRQALCKARPLIASERMRQRVGACLRQAILVREWDRKDSRDLRQRRGDLEQNVGNQNLKRGLGGTVDVEYAVQSLQLRHAADHPSVLTPSTLDALAALQRQQLLTSEDADALADGYRFLRSVESRLRLMNTSARHDLPQEPRLQSQLAYLMQMSVDQLAERCVDCQRRNRRLFDKIVPPA